MKLVKINRLTTDIDLSGGLTSLKASEKTPVVKEELFSAFADFSSLSSRTEDDLKRTKMMGETLSKIIVNSAGKKYDDKIILVLPHPNVTKENYIACVLPKDHTIIQKRAEDKQDTVDEYLEIIVEDVE